GGGSGGGAGGRGAPRFSWGSGSPLREGGLCPRNRVRGEARGGPSRPPPRMLAGPRGGDRGVERGLPVEVAQDVVLVDVVLLVSAVRRRDPERRDAEDVGEDVQRERAPEDGQRDGLAVLLRLEE